MITDVQVLACNAPFAADAPPHIRQPAAHFQKFPRRGQASVLLQLTDSDGCTGIGEAWGLPGAECVAAFIKHWFTDYLVGRDAQAIIDDWQDIYAHLHCMGQASGCGFDALSAVDMAVHDLLARRAAQPLYAFLGGQQHAIRAYAAPLPMLQDAVDTARQLCNDGHRGIKIKIGSDVTQDIQRVRSIRASVGPDISLHLDANCGYTLDEAKRLMDGVADCQIKWLEDPVAATDIEALQHLKKAVIIPIALGEYLHTPHQFQRYLDAGACDILIPNLSRIGGFSGLRHLIDACDDSAVHICPHGVGTTVLQQATAQALSAWLPASCMEWNIFPNALRHVIAAPQTQYARGLVTPHSSPGLGMQLNFNTIAGYTADAGFAAV